MAEYRHHGPTYTYAYFILPLKDSGPLAPAQIMIREWKEFRGINSCCWGELYVTKPVFLSDFKLLLWLRVSVSRLLYLFFFVNWKRQSFIWFERCMLTCLLPARRIWQRWGATRAPSSALFIDFRCLRWGIEAASKKLLASRALIVPARILSCFWVSWGDKVLWWTSATSHPLTCKWILRNGSYPQRQSGY